MHQEGAAMQYLVHRAQQYILNTDNGQQKTDTTLVTIPDTCHFGCIVVYCVLCIHGSEGL